MFTGFLRKHAQFLTFAVIGVINTLIHGAILVLAVEEFHLGVTLSNAVAFAFANIYSYFANSAITFKVKVSFVRYARFFTASLLSLVITLLISLTSDHYGLHYLTGFALIVVLVPLISFIIAKYWAFSDRQNPVR